MKTLFLLPTLVVLSIFSFQSSAQNNDADTGSYAAGKKNLYIDVHHLGKGNVTYKTVAQAHAKDLVTEKKYGVHFLKYWVDEKNGTVMCLAEATDSNSIINAHKEAHGLVPDRCYRVKDGIQSPLSGKKGLFLDIHQFGPGNVSAKDVAAAHEKDLLVQGKHNVNFINYWVDEKDGIVMCLAQAKDSASLVNTHKEAHGLVPVKVIKVKQGE